MLVNGEQHRAWSQMMRRRQEADEDNALALGREFIKVNQWLNGGALAALPVIAGALGLSGDRALHAFLWSGLLFAGGLTSVALATGLAYAALSYRASSRQALADATEIEAAVLDRALPIGDLKQGVSDRQKGEKLHAMTAAMSWAALGFACFALVAFGAGVFIGGRQALNMLTPIASSAPVNGPPAPGP